MSNQASIKNQLEMYMNKTAVFDYIKEHEQEYMTYAEISAATMVPKGCLTTVINQLLKEGNIGRGRSVKWWGTNYKVLNNEIKKVDNEGEKMVATTKKVSSRKRRISVENRKNMDSFVVDYIKNHRRVNMGRLIKATNSSHSTVARVVKGLVDTNQIVKTRIEGKGRTVFFQLPTGKTPKLVAKRVFTAQPIASSSNKVKFVLHDENGAELVNVQGSTSDSKVMGILTSIIGGLK